MFDTRKRVFANKHNSLYAKPLCPYITDSSGYANLSRQSSQASARPARRKPSWGQAR